jgi:hypothetical protein
MNCSNRWNAGDPDPCSEPERLCLSQVAEVHHLKDPLFGTIFVYLHFYFFKRRRAEISSE